MNISEMTDTELTDYAVLLWDQLDFAVDPAEALALTDLIGKVEWEIFRRDSE